MGVEINKLGPSASTNSSLSTTHNRASYHRLSLSTDSIELNPLHPPSPTTLHINHHSPSPSSPSSSSPSTSTTTSSTGELAGIYLGILNLFTTLPQFVGTFISMIVFSILEPGKSPELAEGDEHETEGVNAIAVCLFVGAVSAVGAAYATARLRDAR